VTAPVTVSYDAKPTTGLPWKPRWCSGVSPSIQYPTWRPSGESAKALPFTFSVA